MSWLVVAILAYLILAIVFLIDKYLLTSLVGSAKVYAFYVGLLGVLVVLLIPFVGFYVPHSGQLFLSLVTGVIHVLGLFWLYQTLKLFEPSRVVPAIGGFTSLFSFLLVYLFSLGQETLSFNSFISFSLLVLGAILINFEKDKLLGLKSLRYSAFTALLLSLTFVLTKYIFLEQPFWNGLIWRSLGGCIMAVGFFVLYSEVRREVLSKKEKVKNSFKGTLLFLGNQGLGALSTILQNWAIFLAPLGMIPLVHALNGVEYVFLFIISTFLSFKFPNILKEDVSKGVLLQKIIAIILIILGIVLLILC